MTDASSVGPFGFVTPDEAEAALPKEGEPYAILLRHGTLELGWYAPHGVDEQTPHGRDELYVVAAGTAHFTVVSEDARGVAAGDVLFVAAYAAHRFTDMSDDFRTWVMFYGPVGGER